MGLRVLLIEDDETIAEPLTEGLGHFGLTVDHVATGTDGLRGPYGDVVLLDLGLPDMDGIDVCRGIREVSDVPILILSARGEETDRVLGLELGADDYLSKPFSVRELVARGRAVVRRTQWAAQGAAHGTAQGPAQEPVQGDGRSVQGMQGAPEPTATRWTGRPIRELERATHELAIGGRAAPVTVTVTKGPPEVRSLAAAFNRTAARLAHLLDSQHAFAGEASHQLKTPLAALRLRLENLEPNILDRGRSSLTAAVTETDRLARMVEGLLAMARLEEDAATPGPVDIGAVCAERHHTWAPLFAQQGVFLVLFAGGVGPVLALPGSIEQILDNLLSNALRASPTDTTVTIELRPHAPSGARCATPARPGSTCTSPTRARA
ncbi:Sensor histidine kinase RcsC [Streptomyces alboniger]